MADYFSARNAAAIVTSDTVALSPPTEMIYVGVTGDVKCQLMGDGADVTFKSVPAGTTLPIRAKYVRATGTTATNLLALSD